MSQHVGHYVGGDLTGMTFAKRGGAVYARLYDKTREADPDAAVRERWAKTLGRPLDDDAQVWRIEFELRPEFLRSLADGDQHLPTDPRTLLTNHLDDIWHHLTSKWLVLRRPGTAERMSRCKPVGWWQRLSEARGLSAPSGSVPELRRLKRADADPDPLLRQLAGVLAAFGARYHDPSLDGCLAALDRYMRTGEGAARFALAVERVRLRMPLAAKAKTQADGDASSADG